MDIDARIALQGRAPSAAQSINIFENALMNAQTRKLREQQAEQQAALAPMEAQLLQQRVLTGQQAIDDANTNRIIKSVAEFSPVLKPALQNAIETGDTSEAQTILTNRLTQLQSQGLPTQETADAITMLRNGNTQGVLQALEVAENQAADRGLLGQSARVISSKILDDGTTVQSLSTGGTNVISPSGVSLQGDDRTDALNKALQVKVEQKGKGAQAVSDVKVSEAKRLEKELEEKQQSIELSKVTIDETKFKNQEKRNEVINAKNARRKEADSAIEQIDNLLSGDRFSKAFGKVVTTTPELLRSQESIDAIADVDQIRGLITLESRQKLKGQGTITDSEQKILAQSATVLNDPLISDDRARRELRKIKRVFEDASDRNQLKRETKDMIEAEASSLTQLSEQEIMAKYGL